MKNFKTNHQIGCATRSLKQYGFGEPTIDAPVHNTTVNAALTKGKHIISITIPRGAHKTLSELDGDFN